MCYSIHTKIKNLIVKKTKRDGIVFTPSQLANAINLNRSVISKLIHENPYKRVLNPKIDTLVKIVVFFQNDGFDITLDELVGMKSNNLKLCNCKGKDL